MCSPIEEHHNIFIESFNCIFFVLQIENRAINENIAGTITIMIPAFSILKIAPFFLVATVFGVIDFSLLVRLCEKNIFIGTIFVWCIFLSCLFYRIQHFHYLCESIFCWITNEIATRTDWMKTNTHRGLPQHTVDSESYETNGINVCMHLPASTCPAWLIQYFPI